MRGRVVGPGQFIQESDRSHPVRLAPHDPRPVREGDFDAAPAEVDEHPLRVAEVDSRPRGGPDETRFLRPGDEADRDAGFILDAAHEIGAVAALANRARGDGPDVVDAQTIDLPPEATETLDRLLDRRGGEFAGEEGGVSQPDGDALAGQLDVPVRGVKFSRDEPECVRSHVDGGDAQGKPEARWAVESRAPDRLSRVVHVGCAQLRGSSGLERGAGRRRHETRPGRLNVDAAPGKHDPAVARHPNFYPAAPERVMLGI